MPRPLIVCVLYSIMLLVSGLRAENSAETASVYQQGIYSAISEGDSVVLAVVAGPTMVVETFVKGQGGVGVGLDAKTPKSVRIRWRGGKLSFSNGITTISDLYPGERFELLSVYDVPKEGVQEIVIGRSADGQDLIVRLAPRKRSRSVQSPSDEH